MSSDVPPVPLISVSGPPRARGQAYGEAARDRIDVSLAIYQEVFGRRGISWADACNYAATLAAELGTPWRPELDEIAGIAEGCERRPTDILAINLRYEITNRLGIRARNVPADGCTGVILLPEATADGRVLHGQTWDYLDVCKDNVVVLRIEGGEGEVSILTQTEAGLLARCGINSAGVALTSNFLKTDRDGVVAGGVPSPFLRRRVLSRRSAQEAAAVIAGCRHSFSLNMMVSDASGDGFDAETTPGRVFMLGAEKGVITHANHFISPEAATAHTDISVVEQPSSPHRLARVTSLLAARHGMLTAGDLKAALTDSVGGANAICLAPIDNKKGENDSTVLAVVFDVTARTLSLAHTPYAGVRFHDYGFAS